MPAAGLSGIASAIIADTSKRPSTLVNNWKSNQIETPTKKQIKMMKLQMELN
jgi:hypothetical protein